MTYPLVRQAQYALTAGIGALVTIETTAFAKAQNLSFEGSWLIAISAVVFAIVALWLTAWGALRSDSGDRYRSTSRTADRHGTVYGDIDGHLRVH